MPETTGVDPSRCRGPRCVSLQLGRGGSPAADPQVRETSGVWVPPDAGTRLQVRPRCGSSQVRGSLSCRCLAGFHAGPQVLHPSPGLAGTPLLALRSSRMGAPAGKVLTGWPCPVVLPSLPSGERSLPRLSEPRELRAQGSSFRVNIRPQRAADRVQDTVHLSLPAGAVTGTARLCLCCNERSPRCGCGSYTFRGHST